MGSKKPWEKWSGIKVIQHFPGQIIDEKEENYIVKIFLNKEIKRIEMKKEKFSWLPYTIKRGSWFWQVVYETKEDAGLATSVWPIANYLRDF